MPRTKIRRLRAEPVWNSDKPVAGLYGGSIIAVPKAGMACGLVHVSSFIISEMGLKRVHITGIRLVSVEFDAA